MNMALRSILTASMAVALVGCGSTPASPAQANSEPETRVLSTFRTPDNSGGVYLFCAGGDFYVYMDGVKSGSLEIHTELNGRCNN